MKKHVLELTKIHLNLRLYYQKDALRIGLRRWLGCVLNKSQLSDSERCSTVVPEKSSLQCWGFPNSQKKCLVGYGLILNCHESDFGSAVIAKSVRIIQPSCSSDVSTIIFSCQSWIWMCRGRLWGHTFRK